MNLNGWIKATLLGASLIALSASAPIAATTTSSPGASPAATPAKAAPPKKTVHHEYTAPAAPKPVIDPAALAAMGKMSAFLRSNNAFTVKMSTQRDDVDIFGQNITLDGETNYQVRSPDAFRIDQNEPGRNRLYVYDGKSVTIYDPKSNVYASFPAPGTIRATLDLAADKYGIEVPLDDLFHWDQGDAETEQADERPLCRAGQGGRPGRRSIRVPPARGRLADLDRERRQAVPAQGGDRGQRRSG